MTDHFIKNIKIKDFKCFDNFKAEGFARVNLIGGKNNVGKTAFMEACFINVHAQNIMAFVTSLIAIKFMRENLNILNLLSKQQSKTTLTAKYLEQSNNIYTESNISKSHFTVKDMDGIKEYLFTLNDNLSAINVNDFSFSNNLIDNIQFIDNFGFSNSEIVKNFSFVQKMEKESYLNSSLKKLDPALEGFKVIEDKPQCKIKGKYLDLTEMGDGVRHLVSILTSLHASENSYLFIDEIDNGIHYTMLDYIWGIVLTLSKQLNVQVFATTHSKECIESFSRVQLEQVDQSSSSYFELAKNINTNKISMSALPPSQLEYELSHKGKFRGE